MAVKVAINGFGRIGRLAFRQMFDAEGYEVVAINDLTSPEMLAHLLKYDTAQGKYKYADSVVAGEDNITVNGKTITIYAKANAAELPWGELDVDVVLECTGFYTSKAKAEAHIQAGAKKVVISAPAGNDLPTIVYNVNEKASDDLNQFEASYAVGMRGEFLITNTYTGTTETPPAQDPVTVSIPVFKNWVGVPEGTAYPQSIEAELLKMDGTVVHVAVGSVEHPMNREHYIAWICLESEHGIQYAHLDPDDEPRAKFALCEGDEVRAVYAFCNQHDLWRK